MPQGIPQTIHEKVCRLVEAEVVRRVGRSSGSLTHNELVEFVWGEVYDVARKQLTSASNRVRAERRPLGLD